MIADTMRDRFGRVTAALLDEDPRTALVLADIGAAALTDALERHPDRAVNVGIREQLVIGVAAGFSLAGFRPIVFSYAPFLVERPYEQLKLDLGHNDLGAVLVSTGASFDATTEGRTHQAPEDVAIVGALPGWRIAVPGHPDEVEPLLRAAMVTEERVYIRLSSQSNIAPVASPGGQLVAVRRGSRGTVIAVGPMLSAVLEATAGLELTILYASTVQPFDHATLRASLGGSAVVIVEPYLEGTSAAAIADALRTIPARILSIGVPRTELRRYGTVAEHAAAHGLDATGLRKRIEPFLRASVD
jgi:transketolase